MTSKQVKFAIVTIGTYDGTKTLVEELVARGHICDVVYSKEYVEEATYVEFLEKLSEYDVVYFRGLKNKTWGHRLIGDLRSKDRVLLGSSYMNEENFSSKDFQISKAASAGVLVPNTKSFTFESISEEVIKEQNFDFPVVLKTDVGICGRTVFKIENQADIDVLEIDRDRNCLVQPMIDYVKDIRAFVVNNEVVGIMERRAAEDDFRANISQGGSGHVVTDQNLRSEITKKALELNQVFQLEIAGYDFLETKDGNLLFLEVNANPGWKGLSQALDLNVAKIIADYFESLK